MMTLEVRSGGLHIQLPKPADQMEAEVLDNLRHVYERNHPDMGQHLKRCPGKIIH